MALSLRPSLRTAEHADVGGIFWRAGSRTQSTIWHWIYGSGSWYLRSDEGYQHMYKSTFTPEAMDSVGFVRIDPMTVPELVAVFNSNLYEDLKVPEGL